MVKLFGITLAAVAVLVGALYACAPTRYEVVREITIAAPPAEVHPFVADLRRWPAWSVWNAERDESLRYAYSGPEQGVDARASWTSKQGPGALLVTASDPGKGVWYDMTFGAGDRVLRSKGALQYAAVEGGTRVTWTSAGQLSGFFLRVMGYGMDAMMGPSLEQGLDGLKRAVEAAHGAPGES